MPSPNATPAPTFTRSTTVPAPIEQVWAHLTDWSVAPAWMPGVESMRADGPLARGTTLRFTARGKERTSTVEAVDPPRSLVLVSTQQGITARYHYELAAVDPSATEVSLAVTVEARGLAVLIAPLVRRAVTRADGDQLDRFAAASSA